MKPGIVPAWSITMRIIIAAALLAAAFAAQGQSHQTIYIRGLPDPSMEYADIGQEVVDQARRDREVASAKYEATLARERLRHEQFSELSELRSQIAQLQHDLVTLREENRQMQATFKETQMPKGPEPNPFERFGFVED